MQTKINKAVIQIIQDVAKRSLYPESKHITMASNYPEGKLKYFRDQRFELLKVIPENSMFGNAWVNSGTPKVTRSHIFVDFYNNVFMNPPTGITYQSQSKFIDFLKSDLSIFLRDYIAYSKMGAELEDSKADNHIPESLKFNITDDELQVLYKSFCKNIFDKKHIPEECYFNYAIRGDQIPTEKLPYKPLMIREKSIGTLRIEISDLQKKNGLDQKSVSRPNKRKLTELFIDHNKEPLKSTSGNF